MYYHSIFKVRLENKATICCDSNGTLNDNIEQTIGLFSWGSSQVLVTETKENELINCHYVSEFKIEVISEEKIKFDLDKSLKEIDIEKDCVAYFVTENDELDDQQWADLIRSGHIKSSCEFLQKNKEITTKENVAIQVRYYGPCENTVNPGLEHWQLDEEGNDHCWVDWERLADDEREINWEVEREEIE